MPDAGRAFLRRLTPHVDSAAGWWSAADPWLAVGISYAGLEALGFPQDSLQSFPEAFREGMAARARQLGDAGVNDPKNWDLPFGKGEVHIGLSAFSDSEEKRRRILAIAREQFEGFSGISVLATAGLRRAAGRSQSAGLQGRHRPAARSRAAASTRCPARDGRSRLASSSLDIPVRPAFPCRCRSRTYSVAMAPMSAFANISRASARSIDSSRRMEAPRKNGNLLAAKLVGRWRSGAPLMLAPDVDNPALGADPQRNNDFNYANDPHGRQVPVRMPYSAHEPARHGTRPAD